MSARRLPKRVVAFARVGVAVLILLVVVVGYRVMRSPDDANTPTSHNQNDPPATADEAVARAKATVERLLPTLSKLQLHRELSDYFEEKRSEIRFPRSIQSRVASISLFYGDDFEKRRQFYFDAKEVLERELADLPKVFRILRELTASEAIDELTVENAINEATKLTVLDLDYYRQAIRKLSETDRDLEGAKGALPSIERSVEEAKQRLSSTIAEQARSTEQLLNDFKPGGRFAAVKGQYKQQLIERHDQQKQVVIGAAKSALSSAETGIANQHRIISELQQAVAERKRAAITSLSTTLKEHETRVNDLLDAMHDAGLPDEAAEHREAADSLTGEISGVLKQLRDEVEANEPKLPALSTQDLVHIGGLTHRVDGNLYYLDDKVIEIPEQYKTLYVKKHSGLSPNQVGFRYNWFRFVGNVTGTNGLGMSVSLERYECDPDYSEWVQDYENYRREFQSLLQILEPLEYEGAYSLDTLVEVITRLVGAEKVAGALAAGDKQFRDGLAARKPRQMSSTLANKTDVDHPLVGNSTKPIDNALATSKPNEPKFNGDEPKVQPEPQPEPAKTAQLKTSTSSPVDGSSASPVGHASNNRSQSPLLEKVQIPVPKDNLRLIHRLVDRTPDRGGSLMRWYCGSKQEIEQIQNADAKWAYRGPLGYGLARQEAGTKPLWRYTRNAERQIVGYFVGEPERKGERQEDLVAFVWTEAAPGRIPVHLMQSSWTPMQLEPDTKQREFLTTRAGWKSIGVFYLYSPESESTGN